MYDPLPKQLGLKKSFIHGYGLFAKEFIPKGTVLGISHVAHDLFPDGWIRTPLGGYYNHSETPNCELVDNNMDDGFITGIKLLRVIVDIKKRRETIDEFMIDDFILKGYNPFPPIKMDMAV